jgi:hypothetical protein
MRLSLARYRSSIVHYEHMFLTLNLSNNVDFYR